MKKLGYFKNNGIGASQGRNARLMEKIHFMFNAKESGNEEVWRARLMDKVNCVGSELRLLSI